MGPWMTPERLPSCGWSGPDQVPPVLALTESSGLFRATCCVARRVRVCARAGQLALVHDEVLVSDGAIVEPALEDLPNACRVTGLCRQARAGGVGRHPMVRHGPPGMILRRGLREPHVPGITGELAAL